MDAATYAVLRSDFDKIKATAFWGRYTQELERACQRCREELATNPRISVNLTKGEMWQEMLRMLNRVKLMPYKVLEQDGK